MPTHGRNPESDVLDRMTTFEPPPKDFDPFSASDDELLKYGFPRRPDLETEPQLARLWTRAVGRTPSFVKAKLAIDPVMSHRDPLHTGDVPEFGPSGWAGVVVKASALTPIFEPGMHEHVKTVFGRWQVPGIWPASDSKDDLVVGFWVGIDGYGNDQVLQAGTAATVTPEGRVRLWAWTEWYTELHKDPPVEVENLIIDPGDVVSVLVCAPHPDHGFVSIFNETTRQAASVGIKAPAQIRSEGATAEWVVEGISPELPAFCPVTFSSCSAGTQHRSFDLVPSGFTTNIQGSSAALTTATISSPTTAVVEWKGWS